ncbi:TM2 domain-containing protein [Corynebacterium kroppenstedtii]|uniref:Putative membrane protein n=1 Tax=Corynebacterium kroppenstedtii (strain DSM 44385 / JCM 11950 / CIP 105744 / CCUG 35717) TaxID=645127 RepID=C4LL68_CORK4|nr:MULTISPECIES: TM2 domain-containing protein [Corynebacterium]ACR18573.1 putative membrane protein [Corynebacterium kroppenstedtii DSM 44385]MDK7146836.1 TM2 domain-containing protein [Corynebacterium pseudokroppenstedtii]QRP10108.1 TM2 domain-containing protein [Corynebacterium kroppenstedtii]QRP14178.1 TM2 domain-containing protein [Corynebacterium kroppenstedtii]HJD69268.1 TM2 domain-containing protein [Corynebacterium kroppenstedtii]
MTYPNNPSSPYQGSSDPYSGSSTGFGAPGSGEGGMPATYESGQVDSAFGGGQYGSPEGQYAQPNQWNQGAPQFGNGMGSVPQGRQKSKVVAAVLAFFLGGFGAHNFYLGYIGVACAQLAILLISVPLMFVVVGFFTDAALSIWVLVEFIMILAGSARFASDANGVPVR